MTRMPPEPVLRAQQWIEEHENWLIESTRELLRIPSVEGDPQPGAPFGAEVRRALDYVLALCEAKGFRTKDVEGYAGHAEFGDTQPMVMSLGHLDVVPVSDGWKHEPFGAEIDDGYLYARGAVDDKGPTMASLAAALALKETGADLPARIRLVFGCNEESGFRCVKRYFETEEAPTYGIAPDSAWPCIHAEKGIANLLVTVPFPQGDLTLKRIEGGSRPNIVMDRCEAVAQASQEILGAVKTRATEYWDRNVQIEVEEDGTVTIVAHGKAAHGSTPFFGDSAFVRACRALLDLAPPEQATDYANLLLAGHPSGVGLGIHGRDDVSEDLTANVGVVSTKDDAVEILVNVRYPVLWSGEDLERRCRQFLERERPGWSLTLRDNSPGLYFPTDQEPVLSIVAAYREETGDDTEPGVMGGGTYARAVPNTVSVGTGWPGDGPAHENDERIKVEHLARMAKIYAHILYRLAHAAAK
ncbi:MAG: dipeptidase PepV [Fimbriimonadales bacterium]|nr:MAG: dipeptidase PepV [Fimbriimonadales bacterium]